MGRSAVVTQGQPLNMNALHLVESSGIADKHNTRTDARGLGQVTPVVLREWNSMNPKQQYKPDDLFLSGPNTQVSDWYANKRIPQMLAAYGIPDTMDNRLISYNAGIGKLTKGGALPQETVQYLQKYRQALQQVMSGASDGQPQQP